MSPKRVGLSLLVAGALTCHAIVATQAADAPKTPERSKAGDPGIKPQTFGVTPGMWTGFYFGGNGGGDWTTFDKTPASPALSVNGGFGGFQVGYNYQYDNRVVFGIEVDADFGNLNQSAKVDAFLGQSADVSSFGTARLRLGYASGPLLPYMTAGLFWADSTLGETCADPKVVTVPAGSPCAKGPYRVKDDNVSIGFTLGAGVEYELRKKLSLKLEYLHADTGSEDYTLAPSATRAPDQSFDIVRAGVNYRLTDPYDAPLK